MSGYRGKRAVVVGAGMAGLLAARVLQERFDEVVLIERDSLPNGPADRQTVPQSRHIHLLLAKGGDLLESFFPGVLAQLVEAGAVRYDSCRDLRWYHGGLWKNRFESGVLIHGMSRALLEWTVRSRVTALPGVRILDSTTATGLLATADSARVTGVEFEREGATEALQADLVVDASGRGARAPRWLDALGYGAPPETVVKAGLAYTSAVFRLPERRPDWKLLIQASPPVAFRSGLIGCIEGDQWIVSLTGLFGDHAPTDPEGFMQFAASLPEPDLHNALQGAERLTPITVHQIPSQIRRHYERMARFPEGFVVLGDAASCASPAFAQGMTVAAMSAQLLGDSVKAEPAGDLAGFSRRFQQALGKLVDGPWQGAAGDDLQYPQTEGVRPPGLGLINWFMGRVVRLSATDRPIMEKFLRVMHLLAPPTILFDARTIFKVLTSR